MNMNPVINLIQHQASMSPENIAVVYNQVSYTYRDVMAQASGIAQQVNQAGLVQEDVVGILISRNQWLAIAPLGVLAAGCAYMPLDPAYPAERLNFMLSDSRAKLLIADRKVLAESGLTVNNGFVEVENIQIPIRYTDELTVAEAPAASWQEVDAKALALLIYTSGSTGQPKGCMIEQGNISYNTFGGAKPATVDPAPQFREFNVNEDFLLNPFNYFTQPGGLLVCAGDRTSSNAMTIGWGALGTLWGHKTNTVTVYVAQARYTHEFMERCDYFTIMTFKDMNVLRYMGTKSGRDGDKAAALGLHVAYTENGTPYYEEAECVIECKKMYSGTFDPANFKDEVPSDFYDGFTAGYHSFYIGKVVKDFKKD